MEEKAENFRGRKKNNICRAVKKYYIIKEEEEKMKRILMALVVIGITVIPLGLTGKAFCQDLDHFVDEIDECAIVTRPECRPDQHICYVPGGWWCNGVESFGMIETCCDGSDLKIPEVECNPPAEGSCSSLGAKRYEFCGEYGTQVYKCVMNEYYGTEIGCEDMVFNVLEWEAEGGCECLSEDEEIEDLSPFVPDCPSPKVADGNGKCVCPSSGGCLISQTWNALKCRCEGCNSYNDNKFCCERDGGSWLSDGTCYMQINPCGSGWIMDGHGVCHCLGDKTVPIKEGGCCIENENCGKDFGNGRTGACKCGLGIKESCETDIAAKFSCENAGPYYVWDKTDCTCKCCQTGMAVWVHGAAICENVNGYQISTPQVCSPPSSSKVIAEPEEEGVASL
ncbi:MAG: hypothetical protein LBG46_06590 [Elusimicrobiota bacterium]|nr:hypothetical protein [Elusimicrobiota bacterium]